MTFLSAEVLSASFATYKYQTNTVKIYPAKFTDENLLLDSIMAAVEDLIDYKLIEKVGNNTYKVNFANIVDEFEKNGCRFNVTAKDLPTADLLSKLFYESSNKIIDMCYFKFFGAYALFSYTHNVIAIFVKRD